ncbi:MAG TPA: MucB/RseB C-terminal domain-containing protein [Gammaproteobacteria bacterium]
MVRNVAVLWVCLVAGPLYAADTDGLELLKRMSEAMQMNNYSGTFIYRHKDKVETLKIVHGYTSDGIKERLITLSGKPREILRSDSVVTCIWPENRRVLVDKSRPGSNFPGLVPNDPAKLSAHYSVSVQDKLERIADRDCRVVDVKPKDEYRYGYRVWIDNETFLLVRSDLLNENNEPVEQVMFTELIVHEDVPVEALKPEFEVDDGFRRRESDDLANIMDTDKARWHSTDPPSGFSMQTWKKRISKNGNTTVEQLVYSDGLASVSVFIEPNKNEKMLSGSRRRGALNIYGKVFNDHHITVVGEVPGQTVKQIAESVELKPEYQEK